MSQAVADIPAAPVANYLTRDERIVEVMSADLWVRGASQTGPDAATTEPGVLAVTDRRILFIGHQGGRLVVDSDNVRSCRVMQRADGGRDLSLRMPGGGTAAIRIAGHAGIAGHAVNGIAPVARPADVPRTARWQSTLPLAVPVLLAVVWGVSLTGIQADAIGPLGLVSALPIAALLALAALCVSFGLEIARASARTSVLAVHTLALIFMLHGAGCLIEQVPSFNVAWRHAGVADYIAAHGAVDQSLSAYFNWPGFFALTAVTRELAGMDGAVDLARWAPLLFNLLYLPPLIVIARTASDDPRLPWAAAWVFYLANWVHQDYISPQGLIFLLYLVFVMVIVRWLNGKTDADLAPRQRAALIGVSFLLLLGAVPSHQLTPFAMVAAALALVIARTCSVRTLPLIAGVLAVTWFMFAAGPYLSGHLADLKDDIGHLGATFSSNVSSRVGGSPDHTAIAYVRILFAALAWIVAAAAVFVAWRGRGRRWVPLAAAGIAPFSLILLQAYGGEILLRIYLFSLPMAAALCAYLLLLGDRNRPRRYTGAIATIASLALAGLFLFARYGNEQVDLFTPAEASVVEQVEHEAPADSVLVAPNTDLPWEARRVGDLHFKSLSAELHPGAKDHLAGAVAATIRKYGGGTGYLLITPNTRESEAAFGSERWGTIAQLEAAVQRSPAFRQIEASDGGQVYELVPATGAGSGRHG